MTRHRSIGFNRDRFQHRQVSGDRGRRIISVWGGAGAPETVTWEFGSDGDRLHGSRSPEHSLRFASTGRLMEFDRPFSDPCSRYPRPEQNSMVTGWTVPSRLLLRFGRNATKGGPAFLRRCKAHTQWRHRINRLKHTRQGLSTERQEYLYTGDVTVDPTAIIDRGRARHWPCWVNGWRCAAWKQKRWPLYSKGISRSSESLCCFEQLRKWKKERENEYRNKN